MRSGRFCGFFWNKHALHIRDTCWFVFRVHLRLFETINGLGEVDIDPAYRQGILNKSVTKAICHKSVNTCVFLFFVCYNITNNFLKDMLCVGVWPYFYYISSSRRESLGCLFECSIVQGVPFKFFSFTR